MDYLILIPEVRDDPLVRGYAGMSSVEVVADMYLEIRLRIVPRRVDQRTILNEFQPSATAADTFLTKLETEAATNSLVNRVLQWMAVPEGQGGGLDVGNARVRAIAPGLVGQSGITQAEIDGLLALAEETVSRRVELGLGTLYPGHIENARM